MNRITKRFLLECKKAGYTKIGINECIPQDPKYDFLFYGVGYVCALDDTDSRINGWPAMWKIVEQLDISAGCGNSHSHQIKINAGLESGIYDLDKL